VVVVIPTMALDNQYLFLHRLLSSTDRVKAKVEAELTSTFLNLTWVGKYIIFKSIMESPERRKIKGFLLLVVIISIASLLFVNSLMLSAQEKPAEQPKQAEPATQPSPTQELKPPEKKEEVPAKPVPPKVDKRPTAGEVSFFFDDADVYEVIQTVFGEVLRVNYIVDPKVKGRVNFRTTTPIPKDEVLPVMEIILRLNGIAVVHDKGLYRIISIGDIPREPAPIRFGRDPEAIQLKGTALVQVVQFQYITSSEMTKILTPLLSQGGSILDVPPSFIIISDTDANIKRHLQVVEIFDSEKIRLARPQVFVYPVQNSKAKDIAALLQQIFLGAKAAAPTPARSPTAPPKAPAPTLPSTAPAGGEAIVSEITRIFSDEVTNSLIILATPEDFTTITETIKKIDIVPRQVVIEGIIAQVTLTDNLSLGLAYSLRTDINIRGLRPFNRDINLSGDTLINLSRTQLDPAAIAGGPGFTFIGTDPSGIVRTFISALVTEQKAKLLAAPHILVSDNREARIQVGQQVPIVTTETIAAAGVPAQRTIQYKDIGIILKVKPQVNEGGLVSLDITQEVSTFRTITLYTDSQEIVLDKTEATTNLVVQDGQTVIIGGLIREDTSKSRSGIPFLSKIPILGYLFSTTTDDTMRTELIILLTPRVIRSQQEAKEVTSDYVDRFTSTTKEVKKDELLKEKK